MLKIKDFATIISQTSVLKTLIIVLLIFLGVSVFAQPSDLSKESETSLRETGNWNGLYLKFRFTDKIFYYSEHHYRRRNSQDNVYDFVGRMRQSYNRWGVNILFNPYFEGIIGPTLVWNFTPDPSNEALNKVVIEPRIWSQWLFITPQMGRVKVYHQFRFEHRWKKDNNIGAEFDYTNRYRYKAYAYIALNNKTIQPKTWFLAPSAEIFMQSGKSVVYNAFEDFRIYTGIGYVFNKHYTFLGGHMYTIGQTNTGFQYGTSHIIRLNLFVNFDFRKIERKIPQINLLD